MGGQRRSKVLIAVAAGVLVILYVLYGYRQAHNEIQRKTRDLGEAHKEYKALSRRFDMLTNELKGTVQTAADFDRQLRDERKAREELKKVQEELRRHCQTEAERIEGEKSQILKEKQQLVEDKEQVKRERDRFSSQLETLTQECNDARDTASRHEQQLQADCDHKYQQCTGHTETLQGDLEECKRSLRGANSDNSRCTQELYDTRATAQQCESNRRRLQQQLQEQDQDQQQQKQQQLHEQQLRQHEQQSFQDNKNWRQLQHQQQQQHQQLGQGGGESRWSQHHEGRDNGWQQQQQHQAGEGGDNRWSQHHEGGENGWQQQQHQPGEGGDNRWSFREHHQPQEEHQEERPPWLRRNEGGAQNFEHREQAGRPWEDANAGHHEENPPEQHRDGNAAGHHEEDPPQHIGEEDRKHIYQQLLDRVERGEMLNEKQSKVFRLLSQQFEGDDNHHAPLDAQGGGGHEDDRPHQNVPPSKQSLDRANENPVLSPRPSQHPPPSDREQVPQDAVIQQPPGGGAGGGLPNNEQEEEVKDLVADQPKAAGGAGEFDNANKAPPGGGGAAGGPNEDEGVELEEGDARNNQPHDNAAGGVREHDNPLPDPLHRDNGIKEEDGAHPPPLDDPGKEDREEPAARGRWGHQEEEPVGRDQWGRHDDHEVDYGNKKGDEEEDNYGEIQDRGRVKREDHMNDDHDEARRDFLEDRNAFIEDRKQMLHRNPVLQAPANVPQARPGAEDEQDEVMLRERGRPMQHARDMR